MKTIDQINADITKTIDNRFKLLRDTSNWDLLGLDDPVVRITYTEIQRKTLVDRKLSELHDIVGDIEDYFRCLDANETKDCQKIREYMEQKINSL